MDAINLIEKINSLDTNEFIPWYKKLILYNTCSTIEEQLFIKAIPESISDRFYKLFVHIENYDIKKVSEYNDLLVTIIPDLNYFVSLAKQKLINKLSSNEKLYLISLSEYRLYKIITQKIITQQISYREYVQSSYETVGKLVEFTCGFHEHKIIKVVNDNLNTLNEYLLPNKIITFEENINNQIYNRFEIQNSGVINSNFVDLDINVEFYK